MRISKNATDLLLGLHKQDRSFQFWLRSNLL